MQTSSATLPQPTYSATFPRPGESSSATSTQLPAQVSNYVQQGADFVKAHWKQLGLAALGLLSMRSARLRPLVRKAAMLYALPMAKQAFARARR